MGHIFTFLGFEIWNTYQTKDTLLFNRLKQEQRLLISLTHTHINTKEQIAYLHTNNIDIGETIKAERQTVIG